MSREQSQIIGEIGEAMIPYMIVKTRQWIARPQLVDHGIDIEAELADPSPEGKLLKIQVKATENIIIKEKLVRKRLEKEYINKFLDYKLPVILVIADIILEKAYYVFIQEWANNNQESLNDPSSSTIEITIPVHRELTDGLDNYLRIVANQETVIHKTDKMLKVVANLIEMKETVIANLIEDKLNDVSFQKDVLPINNMLNIAKQLGNKLRGTTEGNIASDKMFAVCRQYGDYFTLMDIENLVFRDNNISITGLVGLSILYDFYPVHMRVIKVADHFKNKSMELYFAIYYYCKLREKYIDMNEMEIVFSDKIEFEIEGYTVDEYFHEEKLFKYPNRGAFFFIQCVRPIEIPKDGYYQWTS